MHAAALAMQTPKWDALRASKISMEMAFRTVVLNALRSVPVVVVGQRMVQLENWAMAAEIPAEEKQLKAPDVAMP